MLKLAFGPCVKTLGFMHEKPHYPSRISSVVGLYSPNPDLMNTNVGVKIKEGNFPLKEQSFKRDGVVTRDKTAPYVVLKTALKTVGKGSNPQRG